MAALAAGAQPVATGCETVGKVQGICGFPAPEDIDIVPGGRFLLLSPFGGMNGEHPLPLYLFDTESHAARPVTPTVDSSAAHWGDPDCTAPPAGLIASHGIQVSRRAGGEWQLLAVNHVREAVEFYQLGQQDGVPVLSWRGCAVAPQGSSLNDVAALPGGGLLVSQMIEPGGPPLMEAMASGEPTGYLLRWLPGQGFDKLPGSEGSVPNGVAVSAEGRYVFMSETGGRQIRKIDYATGATVGLLKTGPVDNLSWAPNGDLIATTTTGPMPENCFTQPGPCLAPFDVLEIDPETMQAKILHRQEGPPMGAASVAVVHGSGIYVGSFKGEQMMWIMQP
jgi:hypothetical protein